MCIWKNACKNTRILDFVWYCEGLSMRVCDKQGKNCQNFPLPHSKHVGTRVHCIPSTYKTTTGIWASSDMCVWEYKEKYDGHHCTGRISQRCVCAHVLFLTRFSWLRAFTLSSSPRMYFTSSTPFILYSSTMIAREKHK